MMDAQRHVALVEILAAAPLVCLFAACQADPGAVDLVVRDSAGVRIVENGEPSSGQAALRLADEPSLLVGWAPEDPRFTAIASGARLSDGAVAVADRGSLTLWLLDAEGNASEVGGPGEGPGEFRAISSITVVGDDTIVVEDDGNQRLSLFHSGDLAREVSVDGLAALQLGVVGEFDDQALALTPSAYRPGFDEEWLQGVVALQDLTSGALDTVASYDWIPNSSLAERWVFSPTGHGSAGRRTIVVGRGDRSEVRWISPSGQLVQISRWSAEESLLTDSVWNVYATSFQERYAGRPDSAAAVERLRQRRERPDETLPHIGELRVDARGNVWVGAFTVDYRHHPRYIVLAPTGEWLGTVDMPPRFHVLRIGADEVLGVLRNALDVEAVALYELER